MTTLHTEKFSDDITINIEVDEDCPNPWGDFMGVGVKGMELVGNNNYHLYGDKDRFDLLTTAKSMQDTPSMTLREAVADYVYVERTFQKPEPTTCPNEAPFPKPEPTTCLNEAPFPTLLRAVRSLVDLEDVSKHYALKRDEDGFDVVLLDNWGTIFGAFYKDSGLWFAVDVGCYSAEFGAASEALDLSTSHLFAEGGTQSTSYMMIAPKSSIGVDWENKARVAYLEGCMETWISWCSGECCGFVLETEGDEHADACWGFIGDTEGCLDVARDEAAALQKVIDKSRAAETRLACSRAAVRSVARVVNPISLEQFETEGDEDDRGFLHTHGIRAIRQAHKRQTGP